MTSLDLVGRSACMSRGCPDVDENHTSGQPMSAQLKQRHMRIGTAIWFVIVLLCGVEVMHGIVQCNQPVDLQYL